MLAPQPKSERSEARLRATKKEIIRTMRTLTTMMIMTGLVALAGCSYLKQPDAYIKQPTICIDKKWYGYHKTGGCPSTLKASAPDASQEMAARLAALERATQLPVTILLLGVRRIAGLR